MPKASIERNSHNCYSQCAAARIPRHSGDNPKHPNRVSDTSFLRSHTLLIHYAASPQLTASKCSQPSTASQRPFASRCPPSPSRQVLKIFIYKKLLIKKKGSCFDTKMSLLRRRVNVLTLKCLLNVSSHEKLFKHKEVWNCGGFGFMTYSYV